MWTAMKTTLLAVAVASVLAVAVAAPGDLVALVECDNHTCGGNCQGRVSFWHSDKCYGSAQAGPSFNSVKFSVSAGSVTRTFFASADCTPGASDFSHVVAIGACDSGTTFNVLSGWCQATSTPSGDFTQRSIDVLLHHEDTNCGVDGRVHHSFISEFCDHDCARMTLQQNGVDRTPYGQPACAGNPFHAFTFPFDQCTVGGNTGVFAPSQPIGAVHHCKPVSRTLLGLPECQGSPDGGGGNDDPPAECVDNTAVPPQHGTGEFDLVTVHSCRDMPCSTSDPDPQCNSEPEQYITEQCMLGAGDDDGSNSWIINKQADGSYQRHLFSSDDCTGPILSSQPVGENGGCVGGEVVVKILKGWCSRTQSAEHQHPAILMRLHEDSSDCSNDNVHSRVFVNGMCSGQREVFTCGQGVVQRAAYGTPDCSGDPTETGDFPQNQCVAIHTQFSIFASCADNMFCRTTSVCDGALGSVGSGSGGGDDDDGLEFDAGEPCIDDQASVTSSNTKSATLCFAGQGGCHHP